MAESLSNISMSSNFNRQLSRVACYYGRYHIGPRSPARLEIDTSLLASPNDGSVCDRDTRVVDTVNEYGLIHSVCVHRPCDGAKLWHLVDKLNPLFMIRYILGFYNQIDLTRPTGLHLQTLVYRCLMDRLSFIDRREAIHVYYSTSHVLRFGIDSSVFRDYDGTIWSMGYNPDVHGRRDPHKRPILPIYSQLSRASGSGSPPSRRRRISPTSETAYITPTILSVSSGSRRDAASPAGGDVEDMG